MKRNNPPRLIDAPMDAAPLSLDDLCRLVAVTPQWVEERLVAGLIVAVDGDGEHTTWRFDAVELRRVHRMVRLERDFDAVPELAALVADLEAEIAQLRARLRRAGLG